MPHNAVTAYLVLPGAGKSTIEGVKFYVDGTEGHINPH